MPSVIGACSAALKQKIMRQIPYVSLRNSEQLACKLKLAAGQRTEIAVNVRTDDGLTNGASNIIKLIQLIDESKPSGLVWVQFDHEDVGKKTRQENRNLYVNRCIETTWTPIKPVTTQFTVGRTKSAQVVRKQFPLRPASAKTVHRSQGDTQSQIVVNLNTNRAISHIHYVALSRVTTIEGLYITDLCEDKISVDQRVVKEMEMLRTERSLKLSFTPLYMLDHSDLKVCYLNARSLHKHIEDVRKDINYSSTDILIFAETRFSSFDPNEMYNIVVIAYSEMIFLNILVLDDHMVEQLFIVESLCKKGYPYAHNLNGIEVTIIKTTSHPNLTIVGLYRSPSTALSCLLSALRTILDENYSSQNIIVGDFNVNWMVESHRQSLYNLMVMENDYTQLITNFTTDSKTLIDHVYTNLIEESIYAGILETYFSDHKAIWASLKT